MVFHKLKPKKDALASFFMQQAYAGISRTEALRIASFNAA